MTTIYLNGKPLQDVDDLVLHCIQTLTTREVLTRLRDEMGSAYIRGATGEELMNIAYQHVTRACEAEAKLFIDTERTVLEDDLAQKENRDGSEGRDEREGSA